MDDPARIIVLDEFRGQMSYSQLLAILDVYSRNQIHCRYQNVRALWEKVYICQQTSRNRKPTPGDIIRSTRRESGNNRGHGSKRTVTGLTLSAGPVVRPIWRNSGPMIGTGTPATVNGWPQKEKPAPPNRWSGSRPESGNIVFRTKEKWMLKHGSIEKSSERN